MKPDELADDCLSPDCGRIRNELPGHLYGEVAPDARAAIEQHLAACPACREEWNALRETHALLERWETPPASDDPHLLALEIAAQARAAAPRGPRRARLVRWTARLAGAAAALVFVMGALNTHATVSGGHFQVSFSLPWSDPSRTVQALPEDWRDEMHRIAAEETDLRAVSIQNSQEELFQRCSLMTQQELLRLSKAVDFALAQNQKAWDTRLVSLGREAMLSDLETRRAVTDLAAATLPVSQVSPSQGGR